MGHVYSETPCTSSNPEHTKESIVFRVWGLVGYVPKRKIWDFGFIKRVILKV